MSGASIPADNLADNLRLFLLARGWRVAGGALIFIGVRRPRGARHAVAAQLVSSVQCREGAAHRQLARAAGRPLRWLRGQRARAGSAVQCPKRVQAPLDAFARGSD